MCDLVFVFRIPVLAFSQDKYYSNLDKLKQPYASYVKRFQLFYDVIVVNKLSNLRFYFYYFSTKKYSLFLFHLRLTVTV